jgi:SAM-dependent methyltransferase
MTEPRRRSNVFGEAADEYDAVRPDYPCALVADLLGGAGPGPVLEVGAGTGKATAAFAAHRVDLVCLEPDARMAAVLERRAFPGVRVVVDQFENWPPDRGYGLVFSAQAWHWVDRAERNDRAWAALAPGGLLGLFWNAFFIADPGIYQALHEIDRRYWPELEETMNQWQSPLRPAEAQSFAEEWAELDLHDDPRFTDLRSRNYPRQLRYSATDYARFQSTTSLFRMLEPDRLETIRAEAVAAIEARGGTVDIRAECHLATARRL